MAILKQISVFLEEEGFPIERVEERDVLRTLVEGDNGVWTLVVVVREDTHQAIFYSHIEGRTTPEHRRSEMCEFLNRINYRTVYGSFEMDMRDGETSFRTALDLEDVELNGNMIRNALYTNLSTMDRYHHLLLTMMGDNAPSAAELAAEPAEQQV